MCNQLVRPFLFSLMAATLLAGTLAGQTPSFRSFALSAGAMPRSIHLADVNNDKNLDIIVVNGAGINQNNITVLLGDGKGGFGSPVVTSTGFLQAVAVAVGDFDKDGKLDVATVNNAASSVSIYYGNGDGSFRTGPTYNVGQKPVAIAAGDFNKDGRLDLAIVNSYAGSVTILLGKKGGVFKAAPSISMGSSPSAVTVADLNGDGTPDLAVCDGTLGEQLVYVLLGKGDGTFSNHGSFTVHTEPNGVAAGVFRTGGKMDLAVANLASADVSVLLGNGDGSFQSATNIPAGNGPSSLQAGDFNGDGSADLAVCSNAPSQVLLYLGKGDGTFQPPLAVQAPGACNSIAAGTFVKKGKLGIAAATSNGVLVLLNTTP